jgi:hypothetical protein
MTPAEAAFYLADTMRQDDELRYVLAAEASRAGVSDVLAWAEANPEKAVALAESWKGVVGQDIPPADWVATP